MDRNIRYPRSGCPCRTAAGQSGSMRQSNASLLRTVPQVIDAGQPDAAVCLCDVQPISLAMAYVKVQPFEDPNSPEEALCQGSLFPGLTKPYSCQGGRRR